MLPMPQVTGRPSAAISRLTTSGKQQLMRWLCGRGLRRRARRATSRAAPATPRSRSGRLRRPAASRHCRWLMTEPGWNEAACTTTFGATAAIASAAASATDRSTSCAIERAGRSNIAARALPAVRSQARRSRLRPAIATVTGSDRRGGEIAARSARRSCRFRRSGCQARMSVTVPRAPMYVLDGRDGRQRHAHDPPPTWRSSAAGWSGTWTAYFLRQRGRSVAVIEKGAVGSQASGVNFGNVRLQGRHPAEFPLALRAHEHLGADRAADRRATASSRPAGTAISRSIRRSCRGSSATTRRARAAGLDDRASRRERGAPPISLCSAPDACGATWSKRDGTANPRLATPAVARAARALGAEIFPEHARGRRSNRRASAFASRTDRDLVRRGAARRQRRRRLGQRDRRAVRRDRRRCSRRRRRISSPSRCRTSSRPALQAVDGSVIFRPGRARQRDRRLLSARPGRPRAQPRAGAAREGRCSGLATWRAWCRCSRACAGRSASGRGSKATCRTCCP